MLFVLTGSSCSGKTEIAQLCRGIDRLAVFDFDEHGVPELPSTQWRQRTLDDWVKVAIEQQALGNDTLLSAPTPLGEVLASPSADRLDGVAALLVDVDDTERIARLERRSHTSLYLDGGAGILQWAAWHREHARDPRHQQQQLTTDAWSDMRWERWTALPPGSWRIPIVDTTHLDVTQSAGLVRDWIEQTRKRTVLGSGPLR